MKMIFWDGSRWREGTDADAALANLIVREFSGTGSIDPKLTILTTEPNQHIVNAMHKRYRGKDIEN